MALLSKRERRRARRQAGLIARMQTGPARRELVRQRADARDLLGLQTDASNSLARALAASLRQASKNVRRSGGILPRDASTALTEFAQQRVGARAGANLAIRSHQQEYEEALSDIQAQLRDVAAQKGEIKASTVLELLDRYRALSMEKQRLNLSRQSQNLSEDRFKYEKQQDRRDAAGERGAAARERRGDVRTLFRKALAGVKTGELTNKGYNAEGDLEERPVDQNAARAAPGKTVDLIAAQFTDGNTRLARVVWERWTGIGPSRGALRFARAIDYDFGWKPETLKLAVRHYGGDISGKRKR